MLEMIAPQTYTAVTLSTHDVDKHLTAIENQLICHIQEHITFRSSINQKIFFSVLESFRKY